MQTDPFMRLIDGIAEAITAPFTVKTTSPDEPYDATMQRLAGLVIGVGSGIVEEGQST